MHINKYAISVTDDFDFVYKGKIKTINSTFLLLPFNFSSMSLMIEDDLYYQYTRPSKMYKTKTLDGIEVFLEMSLPNMTPIIKIVGENGRAIKSYRVKDEFEFKGKKYSIDAIDLELNRIKILSLN